MANANGITAEPAFQVPYFDRLNYFYGQMLGVSDFCAEQSYFREKSKLHNRCLHGYGTVCGLRVLVPELKPDCEGHEKPLVQIEPGLALDAAGNELVIRAGEHLCMVDLWKALSDGDRQTVTQKLGSDPEAWFCEHVYVCLHFRECPLGPSRPIAVDSCGGILPDVYGKVRDAVRVSVSLTPPAEDKRCATCCCEGPCACDGLLIARIDRFHHHKAVRPEHVHNEVRRRIGTHRLTTITGVNWRHGGDYSPHTADRLLKDGLVVHFSKPVWIHPAHQRGVADVYHIESKNARNPNIIELPGEIVHGHHHAPTKELRYRIPHIEECSRNRDRVLIVVRCGFLLDECCRPVDGMNVGGRVPHIGADYMPYAEEAPDLEAGAHCGEPPWGYPPWTSGNGTGGGNFESWFYVEERKGAHHAH
jgi:hypothetical protein